jgi:protein SCO1
MGNADAAEPLGRGSDAASRAGFVSRRGVGLLLVGGTVGLLRPAAGWAAFPPGSAIDGALPTLSFRMTRASDGKLVTAADYRGNIAVVYFGFTRCPDTCPLTMFNLAVILRRMGPLAARMRVLFVTVNLAYDTVPRLRRFLARFGAPPEIDGLRGTPAELAALAKRCGVAYRAPMGPDAPDPVSAITHTSLTYVFGPHGRSRDLLGDVGSPNVDIGAMTSGFEGLVRGIA